MFEARRCRAGRSDSGTSIHPSRQPVIEKYFDTDPTTTDSLDVAQDVDVSGEPGVSNSMPW